MALVGEIGELADDDRGRLDRLVLAVERDQVAAQVDLAVDVTLERPQDRIAVAGERGRRLVGQLELAPQRSASWTIALTRLPSARPATFGIAARIT